MDIKYEQQKIWQSLNTAEHYWNANRHKHRRAWFAKTLVTIKDTFESVYEVGCNSAPNLYYIDKFVPGKRLAGIDINEESIELGRQKVPHAKLTCGSIYEDLNVDDHYDLVFTSGVLIHIPPAEVISVIKNLTKKANKYIIHMETQGRDRVLNGPKELNPVHKVSQKLLCNHNYSRIYKELGYDVKIVLSPAKEPDVRHLIIVKL